MLIMTHRFEWDQKILQYFITRPPRYLGILGPEKRTIQLLSGQQIPDWVHSRVGLAIGSEGPEEIAISILAEMIKCRNRH